MAFPQLEDEKQDPPAGREPVVYILDDSASVCEAIKLLLQAVGYTACWYTNAPAFLAAYQPDQPGCLILDLRMPGIDGLELQKLLKSPTSSLPVIFVSGDADVQSSVQAMKMGAVDFLQKPVPGDLLLESVERALDMDKQQRAKMAESHSVATRLEQLTCREKEVLKLLIEGKLNKVIAAELGISTRTVEVHRSNIFEKMQTKSVAQLVHDLNSVEDF